MSYSYERKVRGQVTAQKIMNYTYTATSAPQQRVAEAAAGY
jgi:hypothetical protein